MNEKNNKKVYRYICDVTNELMKCYNYELIKYDNLDKNYIINDNEIKFNNKNVNNMGIVDSICLGYYLLEHLGFEDKIVKLHKKDDDIEKYLLHLDIDFEIIDEDNMSWDYYCGDTKFGVGVVNDEIINTMNMNTIRENIEDKLNIDALNGIIDVCIITNNEEERLYGLSLAQELRLDNFYVDITTDGNKLESRFSIIFNQDDLSKGLVTIVNENTKDEAKCDIYEISDWLRSNY